LSFNESGCRVGQWFAARLGSLRTGAAAYEWTLQSLHGGVPIPPPP
jgi:hypothetical protein